ncbi:MAG: hypothetical protein ACOCQD_02980 [archaeon]
MIGYEIVRLRLVNFAHFTSLGLSDLEIDRYGSKNNIILLVGGNGSGKSLLLSNWTPRVNDATNNRKRPLIEKDKEGVKEVDIITTDDDGEHGDYLYKCKIIYGQSSTNCSLLRVDRLTGESVELNPNGLVTSYENLLTEVFGISKNYSNIGYLSPQVTSLVGMKPGPRYEYISTWLPDISSYMDAYKVVTKKINSVNRQVKMLENDIGSTSIEKVMQETKLIQIKSKNIKENLENLKDKKMRLSVVHDGLINVDRDFIRRNIDSLNRNKRILNSQYNKIKLLSEKSKTYLGKDGMLNLVKDISKCENRMNDVKTKLDMVSRSIDEKRIRLKDVEYNLGMLKDTGDSLPEVNNMIERVESSMIEIRKTMKKYIEEYEYLSEIPDKFTINEFNIISNMISDIKDKADRITDLVSLDKLDNLSKYSDLNDKQSNLLTKKIRELEDRASKTLERISLLKNSPLDPEILDLIPDFCDSEKCGVIFEIKRLLSPDIEIEKLQNELEVIYNKKSEVSSDIEVLENENGNICIAINFIGDINHALKRDKNYIIYLPDRFREILSGGIPSIITNLNLILKYVEVIREFVSMRDQFNTYSTELKSLKEKESSLRFIRNMNSDIKNITESIDQLLLERKSLTDEGSALLDELSTLNELKESLTSINESIEEYNSLAKDQIEKQEKMKKICKSWYYSEKITKAISSLDLEIKELAIELDSCEKELESLNNSIVTKKSLIDMRDRLISSIKELTILQDAWSPRTGIPSLFINNFLNRIHYKSNVYLEALNGKEMKISKFEIGEKAREFPIEIIKEDGTIISDASQTSEGQIALLTLAISMAMINEAVGNGGYNIIRIDELTANLDSSRRKLFADLIISSLNELGCKQCVIITHNNEFDDIPCDVIIFPGDSLNRNFIRNKNILIDLSDININQ